MKALATCPALRQRHFWVFVFCLLSWLVQTGLPAAENLGAPRDSAYVIANWEVQDGLPSSRINDVIQTRDGYIWLATPNGLARFDGVRFDRFYENDLPGISSEIITSLLEDKNGCLWYGTESGEIGWRDANGFHTLNTQKERKLDRVKRLAETRDGTIWACSSDGFLPVRNFAAGTPIPRPNQFDIIDICAEDNGGLWVLVDGGNLFLLDAKSAKFSLIIPGQPGQWRSIKPARAGGLWVRDGECLRRWQGSGWVEDRGVADLKVTESTELRETKAGNLLVGTDGQGVWLLDNEGGQQKLDSSSGLSHDQVLCLLEDQEKNLWVGTVHGLNRISHRVVKMVALSDNLQNRAISCITPAAGGGFWVGTEGVGFCRVSFDGQVSDHRSALWREDYFRCLLEDAHQQIWNGLFSGGLRVRSNWNSPQQNVPTPTNGYVNALFQDSRNTVWVGFTKGVACYDLDSLLPKQILLANDDVRCFAEAAAGAIWMGLQDGRLFRYEQGRVQAVPTANELQHSSIHALYFDAAGTLWIGTLRNGLGYLKNGKWGALTHRQGLPDDSIRAIQADQAGNLWIGSASGIFRISQQQLDQFTAGKIKSVNCLQLGTGDGLGAWEILSDSQPISCRTADGRLWYVTSVGLVVVDPKAIELNALPPPVVIESLQADGRLIKSVAVPAHPQMSRSVAPCPAGTRQLEISYTALSFSDPNQVRFRYRLQGLEKNWTEAANRRVAYFPHLPPGKYVFEVTACNNHGIWNEPGAQLSFEVLPVFWQTGWFKLLVMASLLSVLVIIYRSKMARLRALEQLRQRIARDLHDEVGANLGSISLLTEVMERKPQPGDLAQIRSTADQTMDTLRDLVWIINPSHEHLADLVLRLNQIASIMLAKVGYRFEEPAQPANVKLPLGIRRNLPPLFKEILHNIQKHSQAQKVSIKVYCRDGNLILQVQDDGVGFNASAKRAGDGLKNFQNRAAEMQAKLTVQSQPGAGTTIELTAPITKSRDWRKPF